MSNAQSAQRVVFRNLGTHASYKETLDLQHSIRESLIAGTGPQTILFCEHPASITLGRGANPEHLLLTPEQLQAQGYGLYHIERGGEVTYHGPGQLVCYPILNLNNFKRDISWYMRTLEQSIIDVLALYGIYSERIKGEAGVWLTTQTERKKKIASVGVHLTRWCTIHGFALNYTPQKKAFSVINPCGFTDIEITSLQEEIASTAALPSYETLVPQCSKALRDLLGLIPA